MNKKSFLRGFGIGVLFTAIILGISFSIRTSESATVSRAKKLGMVFESNDQRVVLPTPEVPEASTQSSVAAATPQSDKTGSKETKKPSTPETSPSVDKNKDNKTDNKKEFEKEKKKAEKEMEEIKKQLTINDGDWAGKVSNELERLGIIDDASAFDKYLVENGYSGVINSGTYDVSSKDSYHDLAEKITSRFKRGN